MARIPISAASIRQFEPQSVTVGADAADMAVEAGDAVDFNDTPCTGTEIIVVHNTDVGAQTVTFTAAPDELGRAGAITAYSVGADEVAFFGTFTTAGWRHPDGMIHIDVSDAAVLLGVLRT